MPKLCQLSKFLSSTLRCSKHSIKFIPHSEFHFIEEIFLEASDFPILSVLLSQPCIMVVWDLPLPWSWDSLCLIPLLILLYSPSWFSPLSDGVNFQAFFWEKVHQKLLRSYVSKISLLYPEPKLIVFLSIEFKCRNHFDS